MMIRTISYIQQDTVPRKIIFTNDSAPGNPVTGSGISRHPLSDSLKHKTAILKILPVDNSDTTSVCSRNSIADVTFYDFNSFIFRMRYGKYKQFPYILAEKGQQIKAEERTFLLKQLKSGTDLLPSPLHTDWMILIILAAAFLFTLVKNASGKLSDGFAKFFLFRGINDPVSRDIGGLFYWQSTILNLASFFIIALFGYSAASYYNVIPAGHNGIVSWFIVLLIVSLAVTLRHLTCIITGAASGRQEVFRDYLLGIYQSYRTGALFLFAIILLISYSSILPVNYLIISGLIIVALMYLIRVIRLLIIFLNRNISIFYLILYLCALEILPVLVVAKFITGLV